MPEAAAGQKLRASIDYHHFHLVDFIDLNAIGDDATLAVILQSLEVKSWELAP